MSTSAISVVVVILLASSSTGSHYATVVVKNCSTLTADGPQVPRSKSFISFDCTALSGAGLVFTAAFATVGGHPSLTPHFSFSHKGYSDLYVYPVAGGKYVTPTKIVSNCRGIAHSALLDPGRALTLAPSTSYDYCADYPATASVPLGSFTITWTQPEESED